MNIPFVTNRGNMGGRLGFLNPRDISGPATGAGSGTHHHGHPPNYPDDNDDRTPLSPLSPLSTSSYSSSAHSSTTDLEAQHPPEMTERARPAVASRFLPRFRLSLFSVASSSNTRPPRPSSSHYSGDGLPPDTVVNAGVAGNSVLSTPKTPEFRIGVQDLPSTRLHLPNLTRTWTQGSNGPPSRPGTGRDGGGGVAEPEAAIVRGERRRRRERGERSGSGSGRRSHRRRAAAAAAEGEEAPREERRRRRRRRRDPEPMGNAATATSSSGSGSQRGPPPKNFLFCFPWVKSRRIRKQILRCFISGLFLVLILTICEFPPAPTCLDAALTCGFRRPLPLHHQKHQQLRVHRAPHPRHPLRHPLLLPRPRAPVHAHHAQQDQPRRRPQQQQQPPPPPPPRHDRPRRLRHPAPADPRRPGARRGGRRHRERGDKDEPPCLWHLEGERGMYHPLRVLNLPWTY